MNKKKTLGLIIYITFLLLPIYWLLVMSFKSNEEILGVLSFWCKWTAKFFHPCLLS